jgi:hypothetical protein
VFIVGAPNDSAEIDWGGSAYISQWNETISTWIQTAKLFPSYSICSQKFGYSVSISGDVVAVGTFDAAAAYVFELKDTGEWEQSAKLIASDNGISSFGRSVAVSNEVIVVGCPFDDDGYGSAYIFYRDDGNWTHAAKLTASDGASGDAFGVSVAVSGDIVVVGSIFDDDMGKNSGSVFVFAWSDCTGTWEESAKLTASDGDGEDWFGYSVSVSGKALLVGSIYGDALLGISGSAYIYQLNEENGDWEETAKLTASDGTRYGQFGRSVGISEDIVVIGAYHPVNNNEGAAYIF